jgi:hypothetical protein
MHTLSKLQDGMHIHPGGEEAQPAQRVISYLGRFALAGS